MTLWGVALFVAWFAWSVRIIFHDAEMPFAWRLAWLGFVTCMFGGVAWMLTEVFRANT